MKLGHGAALVNKVKRAKLKEQERAIQEETQYLLVQHYGEDVPKQTLHRGSQDTSSPLVKGFPPCKICNQGLRVLQPQVQCDGLGSFENRHRIHWRCPGAPVTNIFYKVQDTFGFSKVCKACRDSAKNKPSVG